MSATVTKPGKARKANVGSDPTKGSRVKLWQVGLYVFAGSASAILLIINVGIIIGGGFSTILLILALLVTGLSWSLLASGNDDDPELAGVSIANAEPQLRDFVASVAAEVDAPMPDDIRLVTEAEIGFHERTRFFGLKVDSSVLVIGLPYLHALSRQELAAVVGHELAHTAESRVTEGPRALRTLQAAQQLIAQERRGFVNAVYGSYARKVFRSIGGVGVAQEEAAEQAAIEAYGSQAMRAALDKHDAVVVANDQLLRDYVVPALQNKVHPVDMFSGFGEMLASSARSEARSAAIARRQGKARGEFVLHRTPVERIDALDDHEVVSPQVVVPRPDQAAHTLLDADAKSCEIVVGAWASGLMGCSTEPRSWQELAEEIYSTQSQTIASAGFDADDDAAPRDRLDQALEWSKSKDFEKLDGRLDALAIGDGQGTPDDRRSVWAANVVLEAAAAQPSHQWQHDWEGHPQLVDGDGGVFDPVLIAELLVAGEADQARAEFEAATA